MANGQIGAREWLAKKQREIIWCSNQPGKLMISKSACSKRHMISRKENLNDMMKGDLFNYAYKTGLSLCRECPIGKKLAVSSPAARFSNESRDHRTERLPKNHRAGRQSPQIVGSKSASR